MSAADDLAEIEQIDLALHSTLCAAVSIETIFTDRWRLLVIYDADHRFHAKVVRGHAAMKRNRGTPIEKIIVKVLP